MINNRKILKFIPFWEETAILQFINKNYKSDTFQIKDFEVYCLHWVFLISKNLKLKSKMVKLVFDFWDIYYTLFLRHHCICSESLILNVPYYYSNFNFDATNSQTLRMKRSILGTVQKINKILFMIKYRHLYHT